MDARAQAEQRMAADLREKWTAAHEFLTYSLSDQQKYGLSVLAAKLAAEEIAKAVMERDREWLRSDTDNEGDTIAWHLVCADVESADG